MTTPIKDFCKNHKITVAQFLGEENIEGDLYLRSLTSIPENFNPTVGGDLYLRSLTSIPDNFNPTVGWRLDLRSLTSIPENFNPTVGGDLDLRSLTSIPENFNPTVGGSLYLGSLTSIPDNFNPTVGGSLYLRSLTSIPENFNPTVGGGLYLGSLTSIPENFNPTVGGSLYWKNGNKHIGSKVNRNFFWEKNDKIYAYIDGIFCEVLSEKQQTINEETCKIYSAKKVNRDEHFFVVNKGEYYAHGEDLQKAFGDLQFKIVAEKLKNKPIEKDTMITVNHYRLLTGSCEMGVKSWMEQNKITKEVMRADELLPLLKKTNAYGVEKFEKLVKF